MALLWYSEDDDPGLWVPALRQNLPDLDLRVWPEMGALDEIDAALVWLPPPGLLASLPNLRAVFSIAAGVDALLRDPSLPDLPVCRMLDPSLKERMAEYVQLQALRYHRLLDVFAAEQRQHVWRYRHPQPPRATRVGVMGLGEIGGHTAVTLVRHGFTVAGWSRSRREAPGVQTFAGENGLEPFLAELDILVCLLPLTEATQDMLNAALFARMKTGARLIQVGRGPQLVPQDLIEALDAGRLAHATLDVVPEEPLPAASPLWDHPRIDITPHIASGTDPETAAAFVADNYRRLQAGEPLLGLVDRGRGY